jgi:hypothetical protein
MVKLFISLRLLKLFILSNCFIFKDRSSYFLKKQSGHKYGDNIRRKTTCHFLENQKSLVWRQESSPCLLPSIWIFQVFGYPSMMTTSLAFPSKFLGRKDSNLRLVPWPICWLSRNAACSPAAADLRWELLVILVRTKWIACTLVKAKSGEHKVVGGPDGRLNKWFGSLFIYSFIPLPS